MSLYVDSSALLKRYIDEPDSDQAERVLLNDPVWLTAAHTQVEVCRNLARLLGRGAALARARQSFAVDWDRMHVVALDATTCSMAADLAEITLARSLDALHLAAAQRIGQATLSLLTFDLRQAQVARQLGFAVVP